MEARAAAEPPRPPRPPGASPASRPGLQVKRHAPCLNHPYRDPIQVQHEIVAVNRQEVNDHGTAVAAMDKATRWVGHGP